VRTYVVTGCAGFIGSHLTEALLDRGDSVVGIDAFSDYYPRELKEANVDSFREDERFRLVEADLSSAPLGDLIGGVEVEGVFHLAAQPGVRGSWGETFSVNARENINATQRLFEAASASGTRVVWASTSSIYGNAEGFPTREDARPQPISPYGVTKLSCESLAAAYANSFGLDQVAMRFFTVYGPRQRPDMAFTRVIRALASGRPFHVFGSGEQSRDVTYVADAVSAMIAAMEDAPAGRVYNVGGGSEASLNHVIALCEEFSGRRLNRIQEEVAAGDVKRTSADTTHIRTELGWSPETSLEDGLLAHLAWGGLGTAAVAAAS
jgi:nucleoside-diphosphate-sugar epimerase